MTPISLLSLIKWKRALFCQAHCLKVIFASCVIHIKALHPVADAHFCYSACHRDGPALFQHNLQNIMIQLDALVLVQLGGRLFDHLRIFGECVLFYAKKVSGRSGNRGAFKIGRRV